MSVKILTVALSLLFIPVALDTRPAMKLPVFGGLGISLGLGLCFARPAQIDHIAHTTSMPWIAAGCKNFAECIFRMIKRPARSS